MKKRFALAVPVFWALILGCENSPAPFLHDELKKNPVSLQEADDAEDYTATASTLTNGLIAFYPFSGNAKNQSSDAYHGKVYGARLAADRFGNLNCAYRFDGVDDYIAVNGFPALDSTFTYVAWIQVTGDTEHHQSFGAHGEGGAVGETWNFGYNSVQKLWDMFDRTNLTWQVSQEICSIWTHVAIVYDKTERRIYVNGRLVATQTIRTPIRHGTSNTLRIGSLVPGNQQFKGAIDDVRIYNRALAVNEIRRIYYK